MSAISPPARGSRRRQGWLANARWRRALSVTWIALMPPTITIKLNGQDRAVPANSSVAALLESLGLAGQPVLVEHNGTAVFPRDFSATALADGDVLEIIRVVAGG
jgi:sulfur carrier protein